MSTPAGWYPDPAGDPTLVRYWDGGQWTADTQAMMQQAPPPPAPVVNTFAPTPPPPVATPDLYAPTPPLPVDPYAAISDPYAPTPPPPVATPDLYAPTPPLPVDPYAAISDPYAPAAPPAPAPEATAPPLPPQEFSPETQGFASEPVPSGFAPEPAVPPAPQADPGASSHSFAPTPPVGVDGSIAGITTDLLTEAKYAEVGSGQRVVLQNAKMLKVTLGEPILARQGAMVAFQGRVDFEYEGAGGVGKMLKKAATGEGVPLMRCVGQGEVFFAHNADQIHILHLAGAGLSVNGKNILAFEPTLTWEIERVRGAGIMSGGLFNTRLEGHGWVAITSNGDPVVLKTDQPTFADPDAVIAWSANLETSLNKTVKAGALVGRGSGEAFQLAFSGNGIVIVQPAEGAVPPHSHAN
ncbi:MAG: AIM24 family protein [Acidimicrobiales bacterium]